MDTNVIDPASARVRPPVWSPPHPRRSLGCTATRHGTYSAYSGYGCRCPAAREDWRLYTKRRRENRAPQRVVDATGTRRRLRALAAIGWPPRMLAAALGYCDHSEIRRLTHETTTRVNARTMRAVATLYERLSMTPGSSTRVRLHAQRSGWAPPLAWDDASLDDPAAVPAGEDALRVGDHVDPVAVERGCAGTLAGGRLTPAEQDQVVTRLTAAGHSAEDIARRLHVHARTVQRARSRLGLTHLAGSALAGREA